ncbi:lymphotoxin-alpha-like [Entelurus aequoreus]|uniref:lymphotoxin-alpha-like n=1 Tax=Entelurus aequoreus TaxID=161455 RepID=UPI002B1E1BE1|nr:lymphotoxin-alpha-like [Entelurus aequoreus]
MEDNTPLHNTSFKSWRETLPRKQRVGCALVFLAVFLLSSTGVLLLALALRGADPSSPDTQAPLNPVYAASSTVVDREEAAWTPAISGSSPPSSMTGSPSTAAAEPPTVSMNNRAKSSAEPPIAGAQSAKHAGRYSPDHSRQQQKDEDKNPSALLTAPEGIATDGQYLRWGTEHHNAHLHGGFSYSDGSLVVPRTGLYRVFLQVTYWIPDDFKYDTCPLRLENIVYIFRTSYKADMPLLSTKRTLACSTKNWYETVYTAASFELDARSKLRVTSTLEHLISTDATSVFFGAELLP